MFRQRFCLALLAVVAAATAKPPPPPGAPWAAYAAGKSVYSRSLGPPVAPAMSTISVPYVPKSSPFFPKFVDPKSMIAKKTDMLANLFGGLGPVNYPLPSAPYNPAAVPPGYISPMKPILYASDDSADLKEILGTDKSANELKRGIFGPVGPKFGPPGAFSPFGPAGAKFSPFGPGAKFGPFGPKFGPFGGFGSEYVGSDGADGGSDDTTGEITSRRKRSLVGTDSETTKSLGPPPPYPGLGTIPEEPETDASGVPKQYLPGMFGPFGPAVGPAFGPAAGPGFFISKKTSFLDTLFKNLATSTPAPPGTITDVPVPKSTIVPPGFWLPFGVPAESLAPVTDAPVPSTTIVPPDFWVPSSVIPGPAEYANKVSEFLDKLFDAIKLNKTLSAAGPTVTVDDSSFPKEQYAREISSEPEVAKVQVARSVDDFQTIAAAKDAIVNSILSELGSLKTDIISSVNDMIVAQKTAPASPFAKKPTKPGKPVSPWAAMFAPPVVDPTLPFKQKINALSQVFDMLTGLQKNISTAIQDKINAAAVNVPQPVAPVNVVPFNVTLLDAIKAKLDALSKIPVQAPIQTPVYPGWGAYPGSSAAKRNVDDEDYYYRDHDNYDREQYKRAVKMSMHQGYQSMPPGTFETVQAGGGSVPGHQGGGIKLFNSQNDWSAYQDLGKQWADWAESLKGQSEGQRHHNHHHH